MATDSYGPGAMANRYENEVSKRALVRACDVSSVDEFRLPHDHPVGACVECDAQRLLLQMAGVLSLHQIRRTLGGHGGRLDPLARPLVARWHLLFGSAALAADAIDAAAADRVWLGMPVRDDSASMTLTKRIFEEELVQSREAAAVWADDRGGLVVSEEVIDLRDDPLSR